MNTKHEGRTLTLDEAAEILRNNITFSAYDALNVARKVLDDENLPDEYPVLGVGLAQVALVAEGMGANRAIRYSGGFFLQEKDERMALLAIRDAADRLLAYGAHAIDADQE